MKATVANRAYRKFKRFMNRELKRFAATAKRTGAPCPATLTKDALVAAFRRGADRVRTRGNHV